MNGKNNIYKNLLDNSYDGVCFINRDKIITYWNNAMAVLTGHPVSGVIGRACNRNILMCVNSDGNHANEQLCVIGDSSTHGKIKETEIYILHKKGYRIPVRSRVIPNMDANGVIDGYFIILTDNSTKIAAFQKIEELQTLALIDHLTGLANRRYFEMSCHMKMEEMRRYGWSFGLQFIDIDKFKRVNDVYGHDIGDEVLKVVAETLMKNVRTFDLVARWGGEEFMVITVNVNEERLLAIANRFRALIEQSSYTIGDDIIMVTASFGAAVVDPADTVSTLIKRVDQLLYQSKLAGRNRVSSRLIDGFQSSSV